MVVKVDFIEKCHWPQMSPREEVETSIPRNVSYQLHLQSKAQSAVVRCYSKVTASQCSLDQKLMSPVDLVFL